MKKTMKIKRVGFPCLTTSLGLTTNHTCRKDTFSEQKLNEVIDRNVNDLKEILNWMGDQKYLRMFRISAEFVPFATHSINKYNWKDTLGPKLKKIGTYFLDYDFRFSIHSQPFVVINSPKKWVVKNSIKELEYNTWFLDALGCDDSHKIVIHPGGVYGDKQEAIKRFKKNFERISDSVKKRLALENDDRHYTFSDVVKICKDIEIPPLFDIHHFYCCPSSRLKKSLEESYKLWNCIPKIHASSAKPGAKLGVHDDDISDQMLKRITQIIPYDVDVMFEIRSKEIGTLKALDYLEENAYIE